VACIRKKAGDLMADVKWIKITTSMFDDEKIKVIQKMPEGANILLIWIKLLVLAGKCNASGYIYLSETIPYTDEMLAIIFDMQLQVVRLALNTFEQFQMIEINGINMIRILNWDKHQNIEGLDKIREQNRLRNQKYREKQKLLPNVTVTSHDAIDIDKELDKDKEKNSINGTSPPKKHFTPPTLEEVKAYCNERNNGVDAFKWHNHYTSNGWMVGKNKMKDWKAAVRTWEKGDGNNGSNTGQDKQNSKLDKSKLLAPGIY
jgi:predicted phage replisome organizer